MAKEQASCPECGKAIPEGENQCPWCATITGLAAGRREPILVFSFVGIIILFAIVGFAVRSYHRLEQSLAVDWFLKGESSLRGGDPAQAVRDSRDAMAYSRDNPLYRLRLARALMAAGHPDEARPHLLNLWERQPGDGHVNLELARLEAARGNAEEASRYYQGAIYGVWPQDPDKYRLEARFELCEFLLAHGLKTEAQARLIELSAQLPRDPVLRARVGSMLMRAGDDARALQEFQQALRVNTGLVEALRGAGHAAYNLAHYRDALLYLNKASSKNSSDVETMRLVETSRQVLNMDPFAPRISTAERARRTIRIYQEATKRVESCSAQRGESLDFEKPTTELQFAWSRAKEFEPALKQGSLARDADLLSNTAHLAFELTELAARECGPSDAKYDALRLVAGLRMGGEP